MQIHKNAVKFCSRECQISLPCILSSNLYKRTDVAHGHADGLGAVRDDDAPASEPNEQRFDDLGRYGVVLRQQARHRAVVRVRGALEVNRND